MGAGLIAVGPFLTVSFYNVLELLLYGAAALMGFAGLVAGPILWVKMQHPVDVAIAGGIGLGGVAIAVHDLLPGGIVLHVAAAVAALAGGGVVLYRAMRAPREQTAA